MRARLITINTWIFAGVGLVVRQRIRRNVRQNALLMGFLLVLLLGASGALAAWIASPAARNCPDCSYASQAVFWAGTAFSLSSVSNVFARWMILYACGAAVIIMPIAGLMGARAVPRLQESNAIQAALLTRLRPGEICWGRLLAALWPLLGAMGISELFWLTLQAIMLALPEQPERFAGLQQILNVHGILLSAVFMMGALGYLFASRRRPSALWGRGAGIALALSAYFITGILLVNPFMQRLKNPVPLINTALLFNPIAAVAAALKLDILRAAWLYEHTDAHDYPFAYPLPFVTAGLFLVIGYVSIQLASKLLQYAYRS